MVNKAGQLVAGSFKVEAAIGAGEVVGLFHASDGAPDGAQKTERLLRARLGEAAEGVARINIFSSSQLDLALGRSNVIHAALIAGEVSTAFLAKVERLKQFRTGVATPAASAALPVRIDVTGAGAQGENDERAVLRKTLQADRCYVMDRGYAQFSLFNAIAAIGSSYVCRVRDNSVYEVVEQRPLSAEAVAAGVTFDAVVRMGQDRRAPDRPEHLMRLIFIATAPHEKRGKAAGPRGDGVLRLATNLLDVPAEVIGFIYQQRWTIEIFFRFLKHVLGCRHLLSTNPAGVEIQAYCAIIACLLIALWTGKQPTKRTYEMICFYFIGLADEEELLAHLEKLKAQDA